MRETLRTSIPRVIINASSLRTAKTGIGQYTYSLIKNLQKNKNISISLFDDSNLNLKSINRKFSLLNLAKNTIRDYFPFAHDLRWYSKQREFVKALKGSTFDIYHEPNIISYKSNVNTITTIHDLSWIRFPNFHPKSRVRFLNKQIKYVIDNSSRIIVDSFFIKNEILNFFNIDDSKIDVIYLGSYIKSFTSKDFYPKNKKKKHFLSVGTIEPRKNLKNTINAYVNLPVNIKKDFPLYIVGTKGWKDKNLIELINKNSSDNIIFLGYVSDTELFSLFNDAICLVYPSFYEGFGLPVLEAMSVGTPVITSKNTVMEEIGKKSVLTVNPNDSDEITDHMLELINNSTIFNKHSKSGFELAKKFSWEECANKTVKTYLKSIF